MTATAIKLFTLVDFLLEAPITIPNDKPNRLPNKINKILYLSSVNRLSLRTKFINNRSRVLDIKLIINPLANPDMMKSLFSVEPH